LGRSIKNFKKASNVDGDKDEDDAKDAKAPAGKQLAGKKQKQLETAGDDDGEWEEVVVRRRKKPESAT